MKKIFFSFLVLSILLAGIFISCKKENSCEACKENNKPPISIAGPDQVITLPTDSVSLDGKNSSDPDGRISEWLWKKISGPASYTIIHPTDSNSLVKNLIAGTYQFELTVTDNGGLTAKDTMQVIVDAVATANHPPVANAGTDQTITLPTNTTNFDGSASTDPDNNITSYLWTKISGPSSFNISNPNAAQTQATNLVQGVYQFELKIADAGGLYSKDTMQITVINQSCGVLAPVQSTCDNSMRPQICVRLVPVGTLSQARWGMCIGTGGNKILFSGGLNNLMSGSKTSRVDIYDVVSQSWATAELCLGRHGMATVTAGNKIFFGGGEYGDGTWPVDSVDIYDISTNTWSVTHLSVAGHSIAAAAVGNKVFFAGGDEGFNSTTGINRAIQVDIYDLTTKSWSTALLSEIKRGEHSAITIDSKIYFAGGEAWNFRPSGNSWYASNTVDVYDNATNLWSTISMAEGKLGHASLSIGSKIVWAGGDTGDNINGITTSCKVEIKDVNTGNSSIHYLSKPDQFNINGSQNAVKKDNKIVFYGTSETNKLDIYDVSANEWSIGVLPQSISGASIISVNNIVYLAGGIVNGSLSNQVWKLEF